MILPGCLLLRPLRQRCLLLRRALMLLRGLPLRGLLLWWLGALMQQ